MSMFATHNKRMVGIVLIPALLLMVPLLAMQWTKEVAWDLADFVVAFALLVGTGILYERIARKADHISYRLAAGIALAAALLLVWINLAVGIIGSEGNPANLMYVGVLAVGIIGALLARFKPLGMAHTMVACALALVLVAVIALVARLGTPSSGPMEILGVNGIFVALFAGSALLFRRAARNHR